MLINHKVVERRADSQEQIVDFLDTMHDAGWELISASFIPLSYSRLETDWVRYVFKRAWIEI